MRELVPGEPVPGELVPGELVPGELVVVPSAPARGVGRLERLLDSDEGRLARVFFYDDGSWGVFPADDVTRCPPGVWDTDQAPRA